MGYSMRDTHKQINDSMCDFTDYYRAIAQWLPNHCKIAEVGVADGFSSIFLAEQLEDIGKYYELVMVDSLQYGGPNQLQEIIKNVVRSKCEGIRILPVDSLNASTMIPDNWGHFIFIDASHEYEKTKADILLWYRKVMDGCILAGHDASCPDVKRAISELIPQDMLSLVPTDKNFGVWACQKTHGRQLL